MVDFGGTSINSVEFVKTPLTRGNFFIGEENVLLWSEKKKNRKIFKKEHKNLKPTLTLRFR